MTAHPSPLGLLVPAPPYTAGLGALGHSPSGVVKVNKEPIIAKFGEHLIMVTVHISCRGGKTSELGPEVAGRCPPPLCSLLVQTRF